MKDKSLFLSEIDKYKNGKLRTKKAKFDTLIINDSDCDILDLIFSSKEHLEYYSFTYDFNKYNVLKNINTIRLTSENNVKINFINSNVENIAIGMSEYHIVEDGIMINYSMFSENPDYELNLNFLSNAKPIKKITFYSSYYNNLKTLEFDDKIEEFHAHYDNGNIITKIKTKSSNIEYAIDKNNEVVSDKKHITTVDTLRLKDISEDEFTNLTNQEIDTLKCKKLIIDTSIIKKDNTKLSSVYYDVDEIEINDDNDMRLFPYSYKLDIKDKIDLLIFEDKLIIIDGEIALDDEKQAPINKVILIDKNANKTIYNDEYMKHKFKDYKYYNLYNDWMIPRYLFQIMHNKENKITILTDKNKVYKLNKLFRKYLLDNLDEYFNSVEIVKIKSSDTTLETLIYMYIDKTEDYDFEKIYSKYLKYIDKLKELYKKGLSKKVLYYAIFNDKNQTFSYIKDLAQSNKLNDKEIEIANSFGKMLIKKIDKK